MAQAKIVLYAYGELEDEFTPELERHLAECEICRQELHGVQAMQNAMFLSPVLEPSPNLVARARVALDEALDTLPARSFGSRIMGTWFGWVRTAPVLAALLVGVSFLGGGFAARYQDAHMPRPKQAVILSSAQSGAVTSVSGIVQTPDSDLVQVSYNRLVPETIQGTMDDPQIKQLLMLATQNRTDSDVRENSVSMLADKCKAGDCDTSMDGAAVRKALMVSLRYDKSPAVRMKALEGLQPYVSNDSNVRDAVLETLMNDSSANVREAAINLLQPVQADSSVREVMHTVSTQDQNPYIRNASRTYLQQVSDIQ
ncbi:MAG TPA: zf-HC2 domain-containing protein [Acidobacteriaceae bacterium]|nr:zf-HC2 domain-containing protein [Acidobacteriaceae bacterium]